MYHSKRLFLTGAAILLVLFAAGCQPETIVEQVEVTRVVTETVVEEGESVEVTRVVMEEVMVEVTAEPSNEEPLDSEQDLRINLGTYPDIIDPQKSSFVNEIAHLKLIYEGLTKLDGELATVPGAAESWAYNEDASEITFTLREGLMYSDGTPLNAKRFEYALLRNINPETAGEYAGITDEILGAPMWRTGEGDELLEGEELVRESVTALDLDEQPCTDYSQLDCRILKIKLSQPAPYFHTVMSLWITYPVKEELIAEGGPNWWNSSKYHIGNGPYILQSLEPFVRGYFVPNENYWGGTGNLNIDFSYITDTAVSFQAYKNDEFDIVTLAAEDLSTAEADPVLSKETLIYPGSCTFSVNFHRLKEPFTDPKVREAFAMAVDREAWVRDVLKGLGSPTLTWIPKGFPGYQEGESRWDYDPEGALKAISESSYGSTDSLPPIINTFSDTPRNRIRNEWLVAKWNEVFGIEMELNPVEPTTYTALSKEQEAAPQMFIMGWCADYPDPQNWLSVYWNSSSPFADRIAYSNKELDDLMAKADVEPDPEQRMAQYQEAQDMLVDSVPGAFMWNNVNAYLVKPWVTGLSLTPQDADWPGSINPRVIDLDATMIP